MDEIKHRCPTCGHIIDKREIALYGGLVQSLWKVYRWCVEKERHEFEMKDIRDFLGQINYTRFGDWVMFGGLVYKTGKAHYGLNMERCDEFFKNKLAIPSRIWKDPMTKELTKVDYKFAKEIPGLTKFLNEDGMYRARYASAEQLILA